MRKNTSVRGNAAAVVASSPASSTNRLAEIERQREELNRQMEQLRNLEQERVLQVHTDIEEHANQIRELFKVLGIRDVAINGFNRALKQVLRNTNATQGNSQTGRKPRVTLDDNQKKEIIKELRAKIPASALAARFNVSIGTIHNVKREAGMVVARAA